MAFYSTASDLVTGDNNGFGDIFVKDLASGRITLVSRAANGVQGNNFSSEPVFSPDGNKIAFFSGASNLVPGDSGSSGDVFVKDLVTGAITLVSTNAAGTRGNGNSFNPVFSPDGSKIAFYSDAINLVTGDINGVTDVFLKDLATGAVTRVSIGAAGTQGNQSSMFLRSHPTAARSRFTVSLRTLVANDSNGAADIFVKSLAPDPAVYVENASAVRVATTTVTVTDADNPAFGGGSLTAALTAGSHAGDRLTLIVSATPGTGIELSGSTVTFFGAAIGTLSGNGTAALAVALNGSATAAAVQALAVRSALHRQATIPAPMPVKGDLHAGGWLRHRQWRARHRLFHSNRAGCRDQRRACQYRAGHPHLPPTSMPRSPDCRSATPMQLR